MTGTFKIDKNLSIAILASIEAGKVIMEVYKEGNFSIEKKADSSPLTKADRLANDIINSYLLETNFPIISEENKQIDYEERKSWYACWIVDPLDGTKEFIKRNGEFTVNIALIKANKPVLGVIYVPVSNTLYFSDVLAKKAYKAVLKNHRVDLKKLLNNSERLLSIEKKSDLIRVIGSRSHMSQDTLSYIQELERLGKRVEVVSKGSSLKFCLIAEGKADIYPRFAPTMEWDTAAGQAICNALGIDVISNDTGDTLLYNKENLLNPWFICK